MKNFFLSLTILFILSVFPLFGKAGDESLILYFSFDEVKGDEVTDESGNNHTGAIQGKAEWTKDGKYNGAISLDGTDDYVRVKYDESFDLSGGSFTIEAWIYPTLVDSKYHWIVDKDNSNDDLSYLLGISNNNQARFITRSLANDVFGPAISPKKWYHIAGVQDDKNKKVILYLDGVAAASKPLVGEKAKNKADVKIGCRNGRGDYEFFGGQIDEVALFSRALTESEIKKSMEGIESFTAAIFPSSSLATTWGKLKTR